MRELLVPSVILPIGEDFWVLMGRRVRALKLTTHQIREVSSPGSSYRAELRRRRTEEPRNVACARERESAVRPEPNRQTLHCQRPPEFGEYAPRGQNVVSASGIRSVGCCGFRVPMNT